MPRKKKEIKVIKLEDVSELEIIPEEEPVEIVEESVEVKNPNIILTGVVVNGKREFKNLAGGFTFIEE